MLEKLYTPDAYLDFDIRRISEERGHGSEEKIVDVKTDLSDDDWNMIGRLTKEITMEGHAYMRDICYAIKSLAPHKILELQLASEAMKAYLEKGMKDSAKDYLRHQEASEKDYEEPLLREAWMVTKFTDFCDYFVCLQSFFYISRPTTTFIRKIMQFFSTRRLNFVLDNLSSLIAEELTRCRYDFPYFSDLLLSAKILFPQTKFPKSNPAIFENLSAFQQRPNDFDFAQKAAYLKLLFPDIYAKLKIDKDRIHLLKKDMEKSRNEIYFGGDPRHKILLYVFYLSIIDDDQPKITQSGIIFSGKTKKLSDPIPPFPFISKLKVFAE